MEGEKHQRQTLPFPGSLKVHSEGSVSETSPIRALRTPEKRNGLVDTLALGATHT